MGRIAFPPVRTLRTRRKLRPNIATTSYTDSRSVTRNENWKKLVKMF